MENKNLGLAVATIGAVLLITHVDRTFGLFRCPSCNHGFTPDFKKYMLSPHIFSRRYMKCPECGNHGWFKKDWNLGFIADD